MNNALSFMKVGIVVIACSMLLSGCGSAHDPKDIAEINSLKTKVAQLEEENEALRSKANSSEVVKTILTKMIDSTKAPPEPKISSLYGTSDNIPQNQAIENIQPSAIGSSAIASAPIAHPSFQDLQDCAQKPMIQELSQIGIFDGAGPDFKPDQKITRGEYVIWLTKAYNSIMPTDKQIHFAPSADPFFKDLKANHPCYKYAQALANAGYSVGYEDGTFRADQPITREEMIGIKVGVDCGKTFEPYRGQMAFVWKFSDSKNIDERFTGYIHQDYYVSGPYGSNIQRAFGKVGTFHPKSAVTRCEAAGTLWQMGQFGHWGHTAANIVKNRQG
jgi:outer membrane murein-binding lipoprotein Lpp